MISELSEKEALELLESLEVGRLGCVLSDGTPYVVPLNYVVRASSILAHSRPGMKLTAMKGNPSVCLQADESSPDGMSWKSVIAFGNFEEIFDIESKSEVLASIFQRFPHFTPVEAEMDAGDVHEPVVFRIRIKKITGLSERY